MWTCKQCQADIEDEDVFCYSCGAPKSGSAESWVCTECNTEMEDDFAFCSNCGQPKEKKKDPTPQPPAKSGLAEVARSMTATPAPVSLSVQTVATPRQSVYEASVFASQFPQWDLLPPVVLVRRIKRSI